MATPSKKSMIEFLANHFRYHTMNSWNCATSYARNVKVHNLGLIGERLNKAYELLSAEGAFDEVNEIIRAFDEAHEYRFQMSFNGRSSGYLILYQGGQKPSGYQSYCTICGQLNYKRILPKAESSEDVVRNYVRTHNHWIEEVLLRQPEVAMAGLTNDESLRIIREVKEEIRRTGIEYTEDKVCGRCDNPTMKNFDKPHMQVYSQPGLGMDMDADFEGWEHDYLKARYKLVKEFDQAVDNCIAAFKNKIESCNVVEKTIMVPKVIKVLECASAGG
jgi:hypothetical protein